jgi:hypothetical protein
LWRLAFGLVDFDIQADEIAHDELDLNDIEPSGVGDWAGCVPRLHEHHGADPDHVAIH